MLRELNLTEMKMVSGGGSRFDNNEADRQRARDRNGDIAPTSGESYFFGTAGGLVGAVVSGAISSVACVSTTAAYGACVGGAVYVGSETGQAAGNAWLNHMYDVRNDWFSMTDEQRQAVFDQASEINDEMQEGCSNNCPW